MTMKHSARYAAAAAIGAMAAAWTGAYAQGVEPTVVPDTSASGIRLIDGETDDEGTVEVLVNDRGTNRWGLVCDDRWDIREAQVACRQLGYSRAVRATVNNEFGTDNPSQPRWLDDVECTGTESSLFGCPRWNDVAVGATDCGRFEAAGVQCEGSATADVTLTLSVESLEISEGTTNAGSYTVALESAPSASVTVEPSVPEGAQITVSPTSLTFTTSNWATAQTVTVTANATEETENSTHYLGHEVTGGGHDGELVGDSIRVDITRATTSVYETPVRSGPANGDIRLVHGSTVAEGTIEMYYDDGQKREWGLVCDDDWDINDAHVVCKQLGYASASEAKELNFFWTNKPRQMVWLDDVNCAGTENRLMDCPRNRGQAVGITDCGRFEAAGVICQGNRDGIINLTASETELTVTEGETTGATYTLVLDAQPSSELTFDIAAAHDSTAEADPSSITFTTDDWSTPQTVTLTAREDNDVLNRERLVLHSLRGSTANNTVRTPGVTLYVKDSNIRRSSGELRIRNK